eukprot:891362_1
MQHHHVRSASRSRPWLWYQRTCCGGAASDVEPHTRIDRGVHRLIRRHTDNTTHHSQSPTNGTIGVLQLNNSSGVRSLTSTSSGQEPIETETSRVSPMSRNMVQNATLLVLGDRHTIFDSVPFNEQIVEILTQNGVRFTTSENYNHTLNIIRPHLIEFIQRMIHLSKPGDLCESWQHDMLKGQC